MNRLEAIKRRRVMEQFVTPQIPGVFLEWIESTGTQYIDTLNSWNTSYEFNIDFKLGTTESAGGIFGTHNSENRIVAYISNKPEVHKCIGYFGLGNSDTQIGVPGEYVFGERYKMKLFQNTLSFGDKEYTNVPYTPNLTPKTTLCVFKRNLDHAIPNLMFVWNFNIKNEVGTDLLNLRPFLHQDGRIGMWDTINNKFYPNAGTGEFIAGPVVDDEFWELEYIESTGTQWIDTEITLDDNYEFEGKYSGNNENFGCVFGGERYSHEPRILLTNGNFAYGSVVASVKDGAMDADKFVNAVFSLNKDRAIYNDVMHDSEFIKILDNGKHIKIALFGLYVNNTSVRLNYPVNIHYFKVYDYVTNQLLQHLIPVQKKISGEVCMYDLVSKKFFTNQGTGEFIAGPIVDVNFVVKPAE